MSLVNWILDQLNDGLSGDVIDSYFVMSDLKDIRLTDAELVQTAECDSLAEKTTKRKNKNRRPIGKTVY